VFNGGSLSLSREMGYMYVYMNIDKKKKNHKIVIQSMGWLVTSNQTK
jgi:hypothetical protein